MQSRTLPRRDDTQVRAAAPELAVEDDPFADLLADLETTPATAPVDDARALSDLFATAPEAKPSPSAPRAPPGSHWPTHNYGDAYLSLRRQRRIPYGPKVVCESDVWDVDALTEDLPAPLPDPEPAPWRNQAPAPDLADGWLDSLTGDAPTVETTEARLVDVIWGGRRAEETLIDATEVLWARPRMAATLTKRQQTHVTERRFPRTLEVAVLAVLLLFAVAVMQLLLS